MGHRTATGLRNGSISWLFFSGANFRRAVVMTETTIDLYFTACVSISGTTGLEFSINGGAWTEATTVTKTTDTLWEVGTGLTEIEAGDVVQLRYVGGSNTILDCENAEDIGDQFVTANNPLVMRGKFILLETGGSDIMLLEADTDGTSGMLLEDAEP